VYKCHCVCGGAIPEIIGVARILSGVHFFLPKKLTSPSKNV